MEPEASVVSALASTLGIRFLHHLLAEIHADQVVLKDVVVEHVFGGFAEVDDPFGDVRWADAERHVLRVGGARRVIVPANSADAAGDEVGVPRVFAFHENAIAAKNRRRAVALGHSPIFKIDFGENSQATHDPGNRIPVHLHQFAGLRWRISCVWCGDCAHFPRSFISLIRCLVSSRAIASGEFGTRMPPFRFFVHGVIGEAAQCANGCARKP